MKRLLLTLALLTAAAVQAKTIASLENNADGAIVLTDESAKCEGSAHMVYGTTANGPTIYGCFTFDQDRVYIRWNDGDYRTYPINMFHAVKGTDV